MSSLRVVVSLLPKGDGRFYLYIDGQAKGPFKDLAEATCDEVLGAELRHRFMVKNDPDYRAATAWPSEVQDQEQDA